MYILFSFVVLHCFPLSLIITFLVINLEFVLTLLDPEHCGRVECMFECNCRDESWKHAVSGMGRTMNAVSIFNLDREQKEGLALREKVGWFIDTVIC